MKPWIRLYKQLPDWRSYGQSPLEIRFGMFGVQGGFMFRPFGFSLCRSDYTPIYQRNWTV